MTLKHKWYFEEKARLSGYSIIAGVDEAGRGPLAGPLVVVACILPVDFYLSEIDDSKKLNAQKRQSLYEKLLVDSRVLLGVEVVSVETIDEMNIYQATLWGMQRAVEKLPVKPDYVLVDGNKAPPFFCASEAIVKGDALSFSIGAASIVAKVERDKILENYEKEWPGYGFAKHKGYPTKEHIEAIKSKGITPIHRTSYKPVQEAMARICLEV